MRVYDKINPERWDIQRIRDAYLNNNLIVDNSFQRNYVWDLKNEIQLIETILLGYLIPEIFFWKFQTDSVNGVSKYKIIDGQQRIKSINNFINNSISLEEKHLLVKNKNYSNKTFSELTEAQRKIIWNYYFDVKIVDENVSREEIKKLFVRLNITNMTLNHQELRHADYDGLFINTATKIADDKFWKEYKVFSNNDVRRMKDIEFVSTLLIFLRRGIKADINQKGLNETYDMFNVKYQNMNEDINITRNIIEKIEVLFKQDKKNIGTYKRTTHLYSLYILFYETITKKYDFHSVVNKVIEFFNFYKDPNCNDENIIKYKNISQVSSSKSITARYQRYKYLSEYVFDVTNK